MITILNFQRGAGVSLAAGSNETIFTSAGGGEYLKAGQVSWYLKTGHVSWHMGVPEDGKCQLAEKST